MRFLSCVIEKELIKKRCAFVGGTFVCGILFLFLFTGCGVITKSESRMEKGSSDFNTTKKQTIMEQEDADTEELKERCQEIALFCQESFLHAEREQSEYFPYDSLLTQDAIDCIEQDLAEAGYPVINSDSKYPSYLENPEGFSEFWNLVKSHKNARQEIIAVSEYGGLHYSLFQYINGEPIHTNATISWDENKEIVIEDIIKQPVLDWGMTKEGDIYYQLHPLDGHWDAYNLIRMKPVDHTLYDLNWKYILPIGYTSKNLFLVDWTYTDYNNLCFNDLFEYLYKKKTGDYFYPDGLEFREDAYWIPADLFEDIVLPYFDISLSEFRTKTLYDDERDAYPWQEIGVNNAFYYPTLTPEVKECRENEDGTVTLMVDVLCFDKKADPLFTHEVTIRTNEEGGFQYIANRITYVGDYELPNSKPRMSVFW